MAVLNLPLINVGQAADDGTGDKLRSAGLKINTAFTTLNSQVATNVYPVVQINSFAVGSVIQSQNTGYSLATTSSGFVGVVTTANSGSFSFATTGLVPIPNVVQGQVYWLNPSSPGSVTTTQPTPAIPVYIGVDVGLAEILPYIPQVGGGGTGAVTSVAGRTGAVVLSNTDISGLGTAATANTTAFDAAGAATTVSNACLKIANNLSDLASAGSARSNLGLGTLAVASSSGSTLLAGNGSGGVQNVTVGTGLSLSSNTLSYSGSTGLTSVGLSSNATWLTVGSSPLTANGTLTLNATTGLTANQFVATPNGSTGAVSLRSIVAADIPTLNQNTTGSAGSFTGSLLGDVTGTQSATTVGKINGTSLASLATGILYNTTTTGVPAVVTIGTGLSFSSGTLSNSVSTSGSSILYGNGSGGFSNVSIGSGLSFSSGTLSASGSTSTVYASMNNTSGQSVTVNGTAQVINGWTIVSDASSTLNTTNGVFTAPRAGTAFVNCAFQFTSISGAGISSYMFVELLYNGSSFATFSFNFNSSFPGTISVPISGIQKMNNTDTIQVKVQGASFTSMALGTTATQNYFQVCLV